MIIPYGHQWIDDKDIRQVIKVLKSDWITQGPKIQEFEAALCRYSQAKYAVVVSSATAALHIACLAAGIKAGDEAIISPLTFIASVNSILYCGGNPVFADIQEDTANIDPGQITKKITPKTKAIIPVHFSGHPCDLREIYNIGRRRKLTIIEDAAHAFGSEYRGSKIGSCAYSDMTIFSFHPVKHITTGEGGAVLTNRQDLYEKLLSLRNHGIVKEYIKFVNPHHLRPNSDSWYYEMQMLGFNYRLTDIQAALGISQLKKINRFIARRRQIVEFYNESFKGNSYFDIPIERGYVFSSYHLYPIRLKDNLKNKRERVFCALRRKGLGVQVHYLPVYLHPYYRNLGFKKGLCPKAEDYYEREISTPLYPALRNNQLKQIVQIILETLERFC